MPQGLKYAALSLLTDEEKIGCLRTVGESGKRKKESKMHSRGCSAKIQQPENGVVERDEEEFVVKGHDYEVIKKKKRKEAKGRKQKEKSEGSKEKSVTRNGKKN